MQTDSPKADTPDSKQSPINHSRFGQIRERLEALDLPPGPLAWFYEFLLFGFKEGWACLFGALMLGLLLATRFFYPENSPLHGYDFLSISAIAIQVAMLTFRLETWREARVILVFHVVGTVMELFKTQAGSWRYPGVEECFLRIGTVPVFSGFMYAAVGSYIARIWRIFNMRYTHYPPRWTTVVLIAAIYINFFSHHWLPDIRWLLFAATAVLFGRTWVLFQPWRTSRRMPLLLGCLLVALFIWFAENIGTFARVWIYPHQSAEWEMVSLTKVGSWFLLMIISFVLVSLVRE